MKGESRMHPYAPKARTEGSRWQARSAPPPESEDRNGVPPRQGRKRRLSRPCRGGELGRVQTGGCALRACHRLPSVAPPAPPLLRRGEGTEDPPRTPLVLM